MVLGSEVFDQDGIFSGPDFSDLRRFERHAAKVTVQKSPIFSG